MDDLGRRKEVRRAGAELKDGRKGEVGRGHSGAEHEAEEEEGVGGLAVEGVAGEEGVPGDGVAAGRLFEQAAGAWEGTALGVHSDEVVGEEPVRGGARGDDKGVGAAAEAEIAREGGEADGWEPWRVVEIGSGEAREGDV